MGLRLRTIVTALFWAAFLITALFIYLTLSRNFSYHMERELPNNVRIEWNKEFRSVGLADIPWDAAIAEGSWTDDDLHVNHRTFAADADDVRQWLLNSKCLEDAVIKRKAGRVAYLVTFPSSRKLCLVIVKNERRETKVLVDTMTLPSSKGRTGEPGYHSEELSKELHDMLDRRPSWFPSDKHAAVSSQEK